MTQLNLSFFGPFQAVLNQTPITNFRSSKIQGLLIYLSLTSGQEHARHELAALFWPEEPDNVAKKNLRQSLYRLRQILGDSEESDRPFLLINRSAIRWNQTSRTSLDVDNFLAAVERKELEVATSLCVGELLPSFSCDSEPFDTWLQQERKRLERLNLSTLSTLAEQTLAQGDYKKVEALAQQQLALVPWREKAHRQLMQALALQGERSAAVAQYERCRAVLESELGIKPAAETEQLAKQIRQSLSAPAARPTGRNPASQQQLTIPFVGRQEEFKALTSSYQQMLHDGL
ncbi:MAG: BTAD domain-containing putative transcriptional regulator, partial [Anaerolineae bacterium]